MLPPGLSQQADSLYTLQGTAAQPANATEGRLLRLLTRRGPLRGRQIAHALPRHDWRRAAKRWSDRGLLTGSPSSTPRASARAICTPPAWPSSPNKLVRPARTLAGAEPDQPPPPSDPGSPPTRGGPLELTWVYAESGGRLEDLRRLESQGLVSLGEAEVRRDPLAEMEFVPTAGTPA